MNRFCIKDEIKNYVFILLGSIILSLGIVWFFIPNGIITGGTAGLALLLHYVSSYSVGFWMVAVNLPLLLLGMKYLGKSFAIRTVITIVLISTFVDVSFEILHIKALVDDVILASIFGGVLIGIGLAFVIKGNSSAGGSTIIARVVSSKSEIKPGQIIFIIDFFIILSSLFIFDETAKVLWSIVSIYITAIAVDKILTGNLNKKVVHLVTNEVEQMSSLIKEHIGPYGTVINGTGLYNENKKMILIVIEVTKLQLLRDLVKKNDPDAFLIISEANEMLGRGH
ncbi:YitT family protein [Malaciobacter marinus]|jgi:uncharacterized membrane-anchored protein YitT (DUF2179 family)|uniref:Uncharacterized membrane-anchored protein YitT (DUF2179 family) n=1 Tax=Malaciobacter marinus TaxID=505249 RepID=A0AB36ZYT5_9BACT|nr:YitT family protein [Malaciobacter marinus]PPK62085.1 uncharacterized membrane-anchored protein YitT (DUF2179 family) [Malaciobacter marinus]